MAKAFKKADGETIALLERAVKEYHPELARLGVRVGIVMVEAAWIESTGLPVGPAITHAGYPCAAKVTLTTPKRRVHVGYDAVIEIDAGEFDLMTEEKQLALLDHELTHLEVRKDADGHVATTDDLRPALRIRRHDWQTGGFAEVVARHERNALERAAMEQIWDLHGQALFPFASESATGITLRTLRKINGKRDEKAVVAAG